MMMWAAATGQLERIIDAGRIADNQYRLPIFSAYVSPDGRYITSGHSKGVVKLWRWREHL